MQQPIRAAAENRFMLICHDLAGICTKVSLKGRQFQAFCSGSEHGGDIIPLGTVGYLKP